MPDHDAQRIARVADREQRRAREAFEEDEREKAAEQLREHMNKAEPVDLEKIREYMSKVAQERDPFDPHIKGGFIPPTTCPHCGRSF